MLEYLGSVENLTINDVPKDYHTGSIRKFFVKNQTKLDEKVVEEQKNIEQILCRCLLTGDEEMAIEKSDELISLIGLQRFYVESVTSVMTETGKLWSNGDIGIAEEHIVTNNMKKIIQMNNHKIQIKGLRLTSSHAEV